jgi:hypothetical protein
MQFNRLLCPQIFFLAADGNFLNRMMSKNKWLSLLNTHILAARTKHAEASSALS